MIYIIINNDYQLRLFSRFNLLDLVAEQDFCLILIPHSINSKANFEGFKKIYEFTSPIKARSFPFVLYQYYKSAKIISKTFQVGTDDTLFFFTEYELLNQIIIRTFSESGANVFMIEDGGFATFVPMFNEKGESLNFKERCILQMYRIIPALRDTIFFKMNNQIFPRLPDKFIDGLLLFHNVKLARHIPITLINKPTTPSTDLDGSTVIFLNECIYDYYQDQKQYFFGLKKLLNILQSSFDRVLFKFHPRETVQWRERIKKFISLEFPNIEIIYSNKIIEEIIDDYKPKFLASYFSASLLNIEYKDIQPLYLYHLIDDLRKQPMFETVNNILVNMGYNFIEEENCNFSDYVSFPHSCGNKLKKEDFYDFIYRGIA